jgi:hypothetical protein
MVAATTRSGHPVPVPNTPSAASNTARFPSTSLRVQIHAERIFESPILWNHKMPNDMALAVSAAEPTTPIVTALGRPMHSVPDDMEGLQRSAPAEKLLRAKAQALDALEDYRALTVAYGNARADYDRQRLSGSSTITSPRIPSAGPASPSSPPRT